jgi:hypothetical protein
MTDLVEPGASTGDQLENPRPVGDVYAPFFSLVFTNQRGTVVVERGSSGREGPTTVVFDEPVPTRASTESPENQQLLNTIRASAASLTVESNTGAPFRLTLELTPTYEDGVRILESGIITFHTTISARWGYVTSNGGQISTRYHHFLVTEPKATFGEDMRISVVANDFVVTMASRRTTTKQWGRTVYKTDLDILAAICSKVGYTLYAAPIDPKHRITEVVKPKTKTGDVVSLPQLGTDWQFFKSICRRHGVAFFISENAVTLYDPLKPPPGAEKLVYRFKWRRKLVGKYDIPVYSVSGTIQASAFLPPAAGGVLAIIVDNTTGQTSYKKADGQDLPESREATAANERIRGSPLHMSIINAGNTSEDGVTNLPGGDSASPSPAQNPTEETGTAISLAGDQKDLSVDQMTAVGLVREASFFSNPKVKIKCPGVVDLHPGMLVTVEGTGKIYDYTYTVHSVRHILGNNGYDMEVDLMRQGSRMAENVKGAPDQKLREIPAPTDTGDASAAPAPTSTETPPRLN